jgi:hypothetical protein
VCRGEVFLPYAVKEPLRSPMPPPTSMVGMNIACVSATNPARLRELGRIGQLTRVERVGNRGGVTVKDAAAAHGDFFARCDARLNTTSTVSVNAMLTRTVCADDVKPSSP